MDEDELTEEQRLRLRESREAGRGGRYESLEDRESISDTFSNFQLPDWLRQAGTAASEYGSAATLGLTRLAQSALESSATGEDFGDARRRVAVQASEDREEFPVTAGIAQGAGVASSLLVPGAGAAGAARAAGSAARAGSAGAQAGGRIARGVRGARDVLTRQRQAPAAVERVTQAAGRVRNVLDPVGAAARAGARRAGVGGASTADRVRRAQGALDRAGLGAGASTVVGQVAGRVPAVAAQAARSAAESGLETAAQSTRQGEGLVEDIADAAAFGGAVGGGLSGLPQAYRARRQSADQRRGLRRVGSESRESARQAGVEAGQRARAFDRQLAQARADARMFGANDQQIQQMGGNQTLRNSNPRLVQQMDRAVEAVGDGAGLTRGAVQRSVADAVERLEDESRQITQSFPSEVNENFADAFATREVYQPISALEAGRIIDTTVNPNAMSSAMEGVSGASDSMPRQTLADTYNRLIRDGLNRVNTYSQFREFMNDLGNRAKYQTDQASADEARMARHLYGRMTDLESDMLSRSGVPEEAVNRLRAVRQQQSGAYTAAEFLSQRPGSAFEDFWKARYMAGNLMAAMGGVGGLSLGATTLPGLGAIALGGMAYTALSPALSSQFRRNVAGPLQQRLESEAPHVAALLARSSTMMNAARTADERRESAEMARRMIEAATESPEALQIFEEAGQAAEQIDPDFARFLEAVAPEQEDNVEEVSFEEFMQNFDGNE